MRDPVASIRDFLRAAVAERAAIRVHVPDPLGPSRQPRSIEGHALVLSSGADGRERVVIGIATRDETVEVRVLVDRIERAERIGSGYDFTSSPTLPPAPDARDDTRPVHAVSIDRTSPVRTGEITRPVHAVAGDDASADQTRKVPALDVAAAASRVQRSRR